MIDFSLRVGRSKRYPYAARHLHTCHLLAQRIESWGELADHRSYGAQLRRDHGRKFGFWSLVPKGAVPEQAQGKSAQAAPMDPMAVAQSETTGETIGDGPVQTGLW